MMSNLILHRRPCPGDKPCGDCGFPVENAVWVVLPKNVDAGTFVAQNGGLCPECCLNGLAEEGQAWELKAYAP